MAAERFPALALNSPVVRADWFDEPLLSFSGDHLHIDPQVGIPLYGPRSFGTSRHKSQVHIGFIGPAETVSRAQEFLSSCANGVDGDDAHVPFPGFKSDRGFRSDLIFADELVETITRQELKNILEIKRSRERFEQLLLLLDRKLQLLTQKDHPLDYIVLALSNELAAKCRVTNYIDGGVKVHRDLRRAFKVLAMRYQKPTQILLERTTDPDLTPKNADHKAIRAWNLFTGLYFKVDALPWGPAHIAPGTCFIGISFYKPNQGSSLIRTSVAQAFDENGEGLVLRGHNFKWDEDKDGKTPYLPADLASSLISMVLDQYKEERRQLPRRVVIHKSSRFGIPERDGFEEVLKKYVSEYDLVSLSQTSDVRLIRSGQFPPLRGTSFSVGHDSYLYTSGYLRSRQAYPHGHVPSPIRITDHVGDTTKNKILNEVLSLTKMNWNSANMYSKVPITLMFSRLVGDIMREIPDTVEPQRKYKFYI
jgi:hypothetical protein